MITGARKKDVVNPFKAEIEQRMESVLKQCEPEAQRVQEALKNLETLNRAITESEQRLSFNESETERLKDDISSKIGVGLNADSLIEKRVKHLSEAQVLGDLIEDLKTKRIPHTHARAEAAKKEYSSKALKLFIELASQYQDEHINPLVREMAEKVSLYRAALNNLRHNCNIELPHWPEIKFPQLQPHENPESVLIRFESK